MERDTPQRQRLLIARQPITDRDRRIVGYRLTLNGPGGHVAGAAADGSLADALLTVGLDTLTGGTRAIVEAGRGLLDDPGTAVLADRRVTLLLPTDLEGRGRTAEVCTTLRGRGYSLAIDHETLGAGTDALLPLVDFVFVPFGAGSPVRQALRGRMPPQGAALVADGLETAEQFNVAVRERFTRFQGRFLGQPRAIDVRAPLGGSEVTRLQMLEALQNPSLSVKQVEALVKSDPALCFRVLRAVNSAGAGLESPIESLHDALVLLGRDTIRRWMSVWTIASLGATAHPELVAMTIVRARCCEAVGAAIGGERMGADGFLVGLCSMLTALLQRPLERVLSALPLSAAVRAALAGEPSRLRQILDYVIAYERGAWEECLALSHTLDTDTDTLALTYVDALKWVRTVTAG